MRLPRAACSERPRSRWKTAIDAYLAEFRKRSTRSSRSRLALGISRASRQVNDAQLERMKRLDRLVDGADSRPLIQGALMQRCTASARGTCLLSGACRTAGIVWGLGSDATAVTTSNPFYTSGSRCRAA